MAPQEPDPILASRIRDRRDGNRALSALSGSAPITEAGWSIALP
jgi:hypothetical protein